MKLSCVALIFSILFQNAIRTKWHQVSAVHHSVSEQSITNHRSSVLSNMTNDYQNKTATFSSSPQTNINASTPRLYEGKNFSMSPFSLLRYNRRTLRIPLTYPTPITLMSRVNRNFDRRGNGTYFNPAIIFIGVYNFLSYAAYFCKYEAQGGAIEIISVGSGDGSIERGIIETYRDHFGETINITLVDIGYEVDYRTVDQLIKERPNVVGNCCLLIFWPETADQDSFMAYDIESIQKLLPCAVLTIYETDGISGSEGFQMFLDKDEEYYRLGYSDEQKISKMRFLWNRYNVEEVVYQEVLCLLWRRFYQLRIAKVKRKL